MVNKIFYRCRPLIKSRHRREDDDTVLCERQHILQVNPAQGTLAGHKDELAALFDNDVSCTGDEGIAEAGVDGRKGLHAARYDDHTIHAIGPAGDGGRHVVVVVDMVG